ncbi:hypothetical protein BegalDRAFT_1360 [Beggiatoa alba B18LD]|uniref:Cofactor-independent phosphoglycerate mutase n=1 Tax=Beggiatoa alba B18LD TaxID=395493 RepID=I3CF62_9GAMM|nr:hypothetical protein [Beggiatoa alba]EIJ42255.1 hypothetical protein BegalDRAFT_1360 [Beggiatoa alba B18LD]
MSSDTTTLHLVIADLFAYAVRSSTPLPLHTLATWLPKSHIQLLDYSTGSTPTLWRLFDLPLQTQLPIAPITYLHDFGAIEGNQSYLRIDPVYLQADRDKLILFDVFQQHPPDRADVDAILQSLNAFYQADGLHFCAATPERWYLRLPDLPDLETTPLLDVIGRDIQAFMPRGADKRRWCALMNEIQMLLHAHPSNQRRSEQRLPPLNSLWFWGLGHLPTPPTVRWQQVWSDDPLARGLAQLSNVPHQAMPNNAQTWLQQLSQAGEYLLTVSPTQGTAWETWLHQLDTIWFEPLYKALKTGQLQQIYLYPCDGRVFSITQRQARQWWRWRKPWQTYAKSHFAQLPVSRLDL